MLLAVIRKASWNGKTWFIVAWSAVLVLIPMITRNVIPNDMVENLYWGKELQLGYGKHPPLFAWISYFFYRLCFSCPESLYILTQLNLLLGFYFIFRISSLIFNQSERGGAEALERSRGSVLIFMASICSVFGNEKFNANTILMSMVPAMHYFFLCLLKYKRVRDAVLVGVFAALAFLGKYFAFLYIGCMGLFLLWDERCRVMLIRPQIYVAALVFFGCISWHLAWMVQNNFVSLKYALDKSTNWPTNRWSAFNFLLMQFLFFSTSFVSVAQACRKKIRFLPRERYSMEENFVLFSTIAPNVILFIVSLVTGMRIGSFWGTNMLMMVGIYLQILNKSINYERLLAFVKRISILFTVILLCKLSVVRIFLRHHYPEFSLNFASVARRIDSDWKQKFGGRKIEVLRADKACAALHMYLKDSPSSYDVEKCEVFSINDFRPLGKSSVMALLCSKGDSKIAYARSLHKEKDILFENTIPVIDDFLLYYAFLNMKDDCE
ncbi:MAG: glycosyltransferase family 39 protein [Holosporaceae bacterium]|jgi:4-amino-4-deoxy-L-arabinose transferase-like glycosyltransferase|nr:glycosyltransferase family 39 protein [Holosporaceae bacterium]